MKNSKRRQKSLRRQWSIDVPSTIQKKFREVTKRSKSLEEDVSKQKLLDDEESYERQNITLYDGPVENFGRDNEEQQYRLSYLSGSSPWYSFEEDNSEGSKEAIDQSTTDAQAEIKKDDDYYYNPLPRKTKETSSTNMSSLLNTIEELNMRSPTKGTSPAAELVNEDKTFFNDVPQTVSIENKTSSTDAEIEPEAGERYRRYAICEEMERYIIVDHKGRNLRKYRETLIRHTVLQELCLL